MEEDGSPRWERNFRDAITAKREKLGMSQSALARELSEMGLSFRQQMIQQVESGERPIRLNEAVAFSEILGIPLDEGISGSIDSDSMEELEAQLVEKLREVSRLITSLAELRKRIKGVGDDMSSMLERYEDAAVNDAARELNRQHTHLFGIVAQMMGDTGQLEKRVVDELIPLLRLHGMWSDDGVDN